MVTPAPPLDELGLHPSLHDDWLRLDPPVQIALSLVLICHAGHGLDLARDRRLAMRFWGEYFPARIKLAARVSATLGEFSETLTQRLKGQIGSRYDSERGQRQRGVWRTIVTLSDEVQEQVLDALERQPSVLATIVRANVEAWREEEKQRGQTTTERDSGTGNDGSSNAAEPSLFAAGSVPGTGAGTS